MSVFSVNKQKLYVGAWWNSLEPSKNPSREARHLNDTSARHFSHYSVRRDSTSLQVGLGMSAEGALPLAPLVANRIEAENGIVKMVLPNGQSWLLVSIGGYIDPEGDFVGTAEEVEEKLREWLDVGEIDCVEYNAKDSLEVINNILKQTSSQEAKKLSFNSLNVWRKGRVIGLAIALLAVLGLLWGVIEYREAKKREEFQRLLAAEQAAKEGLEQRAKSLFERTWEKEPRSRAFLRTVRAEIKSVPKYHKNWELTSWQRTMMYDVRTWKRLPHGRFSDAPVIPQPGSENISVQTIGNMMTLMPRGEQKLIKRNIAAAMVNNLALDLKASIQVTWHPPEVKKIEDHPFTAPFVKGEWSITNFAILPTDLSSRIDEIPGYVLKSVEWLGQAWEIKGDIYAEN